MAADTKQATLKTMDLEFDGCPGPGVVGWTPRGIEWVLANAAGPFGGTPYLREHGTGDRARMTASISIRKSDWETLEAKVRQDGMLVRSNLAYWGHRKTEWDRRTERYEEEERHIAELRAKWDTWEEESRIGRSFSGISFERD